MATFTEPARCSCSYCDEHFISKLILCDETQYTDLITEFSRNKRACLDNLMLLKVTGIKPGCFSLTRHAAPQNQERPGCSGETEGVRRYPSTLWQGDECWPLVYSFDCLCLYVVFVVHLSLTFEFGSTEEAHGGSSCSQDCASEALSQGEL